MTDKHEYERRLREACSSHDLGEFLLSYTEGTHSKHDLRDIDFDNLKLTPLG